MSGLIRDGVRYTGYTGFDPVEQAGLAVEEYYRESGINDPPDIWVGDKLNQPQDYCVYVLYNCEYFDDHPQAADKFKSEWKYWAKAYRDDPDLIANPPKEPPKWAWAAFFSDSLRYIGQTSNLMNRMQDHTWDFDKSSIFNCVFPPAYVHETRWCNSRGEAERLEEMTAKEYQEKPGVFAYYA